MRRKLHGLGFLIFVLAIIYARCDQQRAPSSREVSQVNPLAELLKPPSSVVRKEGTAAAILIDTSGSMKETVPDADGQPRPKIDIARRAAGDLVRRFDKYTQSHGGKPVLLGIYEFSSRDHVPDCRTVVRLGPPSMEASRDALSRMKPLGGTPIGDAMIVAKRDLDTAGMAHSHILVITDGENNRGYSPGAVADYLSRQPEEVRASVYFVAFDVGADKFDAVKEAGGLVLQAANESDLNQTLDFILTGKILAEQPASSR
jgi:hypothetical protein